MHNNYFKFLTISFIMPRFSKKTAEKFGAHVPISLPLLREDRKMSDKTFGGVPMRCRQEVFPLRKKKKRLCRLDWDTHQ